jgi:tryptophanyl-tRNA synthetase
MREKRAYYEAHMDEVKDIIVSGTKKASAIGDAQVETMRQAMHLTI